MARRRLLKSDFYLSVNGQSATTTSLEFDFTGGTKAVTLIASVPVDFANAEIEEWVDFTWSEVARNTYSLAVTAQANQGTSPLTGDIRIKSLDERYTVIIQCNEHGNEAYVSINEQTHVTTSITYDTTSLQFTVSSMGGWEFRNTGSYPLTANPTEVVNEGQSETLLYITAGTNSSSSATKEYSFELVSKVDPSIIATVTITQQVMTYLDMQYYNQVYPTRLPYTGSLGDSFSLTANTDVNLITNSPFIELPLNPVPNPDGTRSIPFNALSLTSAYSASSAESYTFSISGISTVDAGVNDAINVSYEPYPNVNILQQVDIASGTTTAVWGGALNAYVTSNYGLTIVGTSDTACTASINSNNLSITILEASFFDDKDYYITFGTTGSLGSQITNSLHVVRRGHKRSDYITMFPNPTTTMNAGETKDFYAILFDGLGNVKDGTITSSCTWSSSDTNLLIQTGWDEHGFALFSASTNISVSTSATITAVYSGRSGEYAQEPLSATCVVTISPVIVEEYRNLRFVKNDAQITSWALDNPLTSVYLEKDLYRGETKISTIDETSGVTYEFYENGTLLSSCTINQQHTYDKYIGCVEFEFDIDAGMTFSKNGLVPISKTYDVKVYDNTVSDNSSPAVLTLTVPADNYTYGNLKFIEGENIDDPALTQPINLGVEVESEFTYNVVRSIYRNNEFIDNENFTRNAQYTIYSGATTAGTGTGLTIPSQATTYLMFNDNDEFQIYFSTSEEDWNYGLEFLTNNGVYPKTYTLVARDNASTINPTSASVLINVEAREYIDSNLGFYKNGRTYITSHTVPSGNSDYTVQVLYRHTTQEGSSLYNTTSAATYTVYTGNTTAGTPLSSVTINGAAAVIYSGDNYYMEWNGSSSNLLLVAGTGLSENKIITVVVSKNGLTKGQCTFTFEAAPTPTPTNLRFFSGSSAITTVELASAGTKANVNTVESVGGTDTTVTSEERMNYVLYYTGSTPIANFDCMTAGSKYTGNGLSINYSTANGLTFTANNNVDYSRTFRLEATDTANTLTSSITITMSAASVSYSLFFARTDSSGTPISTVNLSANQTADVYLILRKTIGSEYEDTIVTAGGKDSESYSLNAPIASGFRSWEWYRDLYYPKQYSELIEEGGLTLYGEEKEEEAIIKISYKEQGRGGQYTLTGDYGDLTTNLTINLQEYGFVTTVYSQLKSTVSSRIRGYQSVEVGYMSGTTFVVLPGGGDAYEGPDNFVNMTGTSTGSEVWILEDMLSALTIHIISPVSPENSQHPAEIMRFFCGAQTPIDYSSDNRQEFAFTVSNPTWDGSVYDFYLTNVDLRQSGTEDFSQIYQNFTNLFKTGIGILGIHNTQ